MQFVSWGLLIVIGGSVVALVARSMIHQNARPVLVQGLLAVGGPIAASALIINIQREFIAYPTALVLGMALGLIVYRVRTVSHARFTDAAAVFFIVAFSLLSLELDWFDARGVITAGALLCIGFLVQPANRSSDRFAAVAASVVMASCAVVSILLLYGIQSADHLGG